jgi:hypothetical protein
LRPIPTIHAPRFCFSAESFGGPGGVFATLFTGFFPGFFAVIFFAVVSGVDAVVVSNVTPALVPVVTALSRVRG